MAKTVFGAFLGSVFGKTGEQAGDNATSQPPADVGVKIIASHIWECYHDIPKREPQLPATAQRLEPGPGGAMLPVRKYDTSETSILPGPVTYVSQLTKLPVRKENP